MENQVPPNITSFIIRFVHLEPGEYPAGLPGDEAAPPSYRGTIRHIPSGEELAFTRWQHAEAFIRRFVSLDSESLAKP